jgi:glycosyltransferase involved in cell wall biosynthesis
MKSKKKFISIIWWYHKQIFSFEREQNYHMMPLQIMKDEWYECEIFAIDSHVKIEEDPNFVSWVKIIYYKNIFQYLYYLLKNKTVIIYSNSLTIKTLLVWMLGGRTVFYPHSYPFWSSWAKWVLVKYFYRFFSKIRINNIDELRSVEKIKSELWAICPLAVSEEFYLTDIYLSDKKNITWIWNITEIKRPLVLLEAMKILKQTYPDLIINIIGEDRYNLRWKNFASLILDYGLEKNIILLWVKSHVEIKKVLQKSFIYINSSYSEWQCLAVYEAALAWNILCLPNIVAFPSVFWDNAFYHNSAKELAYNIDHILWNWEKNSSMITVNQKMILEKYNYESIKKELKRLLLI